MQAYKVKLVHKASNTTIEFDAAPEISETGAVAYRTVDPMHSPGGIQVYTNTASRTFSLGGIKLFSRNQMEATKNYNKLQILRSWRYPTFGATLEDDPLFGSQQLGCPPAVLELSAYSLSGSDGSTNGTANGLIYRVPVVISSLTINYPTDCDYISTVNLGQSQPVELKHIPSGIPVPVIFPVEISLMESHTPEQYMQFSLTDLKRGKMVGF